MSQPKASVVIPAYSRSCRNQVRRASLELVCRAVRSVCNQDPGTGEYEVLVVHSFDGTAMEELAGGVRESTSREVRLFRTVDTGPTAARHLAARHARGDILVFLDSDHRVEQGWLRAGLSAFEATIGIVQGRTIPEPAQKRGVLTRYVRREAENWYYETSNVFFRRSCFEAAGGFADAASRGKEWQRRAEAVILAWRIKRAGWRTTFEPHALAYSEVTPLPVRHWFFDNGLHRLPWVIARLPELRRFFYARYFFDKHHLALLIGLSGVMLSPVAPAAALLGAVYVLLRACERTSTLRGPFRLLRPLVYFPRDLVSLGLLLTGSVRYRTVLL